MEEAGAAAIVLHSLFEEDIYRETGIVDPHLVERASELETARSYYSKPPTYRDASPEAYLRLIQQAKESLHIPIIASLNGISSGGWIEYAQLIEQAGADALEVNLYYMPTDLLMTGTEVEEMYLSVVRDIRETINIPIAVKLSSFFSSIPNIAYRLSELGVNGLVLFNRFYQPDMDLDDLTVFPNLHLSSPEELRLPLRWVAVLYGRVAADLALTTGIHTVEDVLKTVAAGASVAMMASVLLKQGVHVLTDMLTGMTRWLEEHGYNSLDEFRGCLSQQKCTAPAAFERANYIRAVSSYGPGYIS